MANRLRIDAEFRDLCPPLSEDEKGLLRESLLAEGCRDPIVCWKHEGSPILDGHHRYEICTEEEIPFHVKLIPFDDRHAVRCWILRNQLARRNLTDAQRSLLRGRLYNELRGPHGGDHTTSVESEGARGQNVLLLNAANEIAAKDGVDPRTVRRDGEFAEAADAVIERAPELKESIERGVIPKSAVEALAEAPQKTLDKLEGLEGAELRKAARKVTKSARQGQQKKDPRVWSELESLFGRALNRADELNRQQPHPILHRTLIAQVKQCSATLASWRDATR